MIGRSVKRERKIEWERLGIKRGGKYITLYFFAMWVCPLNRGALQAGCNGGLVGCWACVVGIEK